MQKWIGLFVVLAVAPHQLAAQPRTPAAASIASSQAIASRQARQAIDERALFGGWGPSGAGDFTLLPNHIAIRASTTPDFNMDCPSGCIRMPGFREEIVGTWKLDGMRLILSFDKNNCFSSPYDKRNCRVPPLPQRQTFRLERLDKTVTLRLKDQTQVRLQLLVHDEQNAGAAEVWTSLEGCQLANPLNPQRC